MSDKESAMSRDELVARMQAGWTAFQAYIQTLSETQMVLPTDDAGWTVKDHIMHLAVWEDGIDAVLARDSRLKRMGLDDAAWNSSGFDTKNAVIQQQHRDKPLAEVLQTFRDIHERLMTKVRALSDADLQHPYNQFQPDSPREQPVLGWIVGNTYEHYAEHQPWIEAIVKRQP